MSEERDWKRLWEMSQDRVAELAANLTETKRALTNARDWSERLGEDVTQWKGLCEKLQDRLDDAALKSEQEVLAVLWEEVEAREALWAMLARLVRIEGGQLRLMVWAGMETEVEELLARTRVAGRRRLPEDQPDPALKSYLQEGD